MRLFVVPANSGPVDRLSPELFEPDTLVQWLKGLEVNETLINITPGKMSKVQVSVHSGTDNDIVLMNCITLRLLQAVKSLTAAAEVRLSENKGQSGHEKSMSHFHPAMKTLVASLIWKLDINLTDSQPVQKEYTSIPSPVPRRKRVHRGPFE